MSQSKGSQIWDLRNYKATYYKSSKINSESPKYTAKVKQREKQCKKKKKTVNINVIKK